MAGADNVKKQSRFIDSHDEAVGSFTPITDLKTTPLVSLEVAVKSVTHFFSSTDNYVAIAKKHCRLPKDNLTPDESAAIYLYTMEFSPAPSLYQILNEALRSEDRGHLWPWLLYLKLFFTAVHKLPTQRGTIWRGVRHMDFHSKYANGETFFWWGISSCTLSLEVMKSEQFSGTSGMRTIFCIDCQHGKKITSHSAFKDIEEEIILMPGTYLYVQGKMNPSKDLHIIQLREIPSPFAFDQKPPLMHKQDNKQLPLDHPEQTKTTAVPKPSTHQQSKAASANIIKPSTTIGLSSTPSVSNRAKTCPNEWKAGEIVAMVTLLVLIPLPIATLVFGQIDRNNCPIQTWIPQWMIVCGALGIASLTLLIIIILLTTVCCSEDERDIGYSIGGCLLCLIVFFYLAWLIAGSVWVFPVYKKVQFDRSTANDYCSETLFKFSFGILLTQYGLLGLLICFGGCIGLIALCD